MFPIVNAARSSQRDLAELHYKSSKTKALGDSSSFIDRPAIRDFTEDDMRSVVVSIYDTNEDLQTHQVDSLIVSSDSVAMSAGRNQTLAYIFNDDDIEGWARTARYPNPCPFCRMLISRGPVYKTATSAGQRNEFHKGDRCEIVCVYRGQRDSWPGRDQYLDERKRYDRLTDGLGGKDAASAYRKGIRRLNGNDVQRSNTSARETELSNAREAQITSTRSRISALERSNPRSDAAKAYKEKQLRALNDSLKALEASQ
jgi:hypothetical protein